MKEAFFHASAQSIHGDTVNLMSTAKCDKMLVYRPPRYRLNRHQLLITGCENSVDFIEHCKKPNSILHCFTLKL